MKKRLISNQKGLGLLEVMVSMLIITIGVLGIAPLIVLSIEENIISEDYSKISNMINEEIEYYQALDSDSLPTPPFIKKETNIEGKYAQVIYIDDHASDSLVPEGLCRVRIDVNWRDHQDVNRSNSVSTYILPN